MAFTTKIKIERFNTQTVEIFCYRSVRWSLSEKYPVKRERCRSRSARTFLTGSFATRWTLAIGADFSFPGKVKTRKCNYTFGVNDMSEAALKLELITQFKSHSIFKETWRNAIIRVSIFVTPRIITRDNKWIWARPFFTLPTFHFLHFLFWQMLHARDNFKQLSTR